MKSKKMMKKILVIGMIASMIGSIVGCQSVGEHTKAPDAAEKTENNSDADIDTENEDTGNADTENTNTENEDTGNTDTESEDTGNADTENADTKNEDTGNTNAQEELVGEVVNTNIDSVTISEILVEDMGDEGILTVGPASPEDEELITIYFHDMAEYEFLTVKNGGADVESRKGAFADIKKGMELDMKGDWDGDDFYADQVVIIDLK